MAHAWPEELKQEIGEINAKKVVPVHTEDAEGFGRFSKNVEAIKQNSVLKI